MKATVSYTNLLRHLRVLERSTAPNSKKLEAAYRRVGLIYVANIKANILAWKSKGHLYKRGALINSIKYELEENGVKIMSAGVPYARIHEFGTQGRGGKLKDIEPKPPRKWLTIPMARQYERVKPRSLDLQFSLLKPNGKHKERAALWDIRKKRLAYLLLKKVAIPARPYFFPALKDENLSRRSMQILRQAIGLED